jgi:hypothetical protein
LNDLPHYRKEQIWKRMNIDLLREALARWSIKAGKAWSTFNLFASGASVGCRGHDIDETPVQVLNGENRTPNICCPPSQRLSRR